MTAEETGCETETTTSASRKLQPRRSYPARALSRRRRVLAYSLFALLPVSALAVIAVLQLMASSAAAATGGCGGG
jgi:hypothetical protein